LSDQHTDAGALMVSLASGQVLLVQDIDRSSAPAELLSLLSREGFGSMLSVPLQTGGNFLGGLLVASHRAGQFTPRDARWLRVLGQQAGVAIENRRLRTKIWEAAESWFAQPTTPSLTLTASEAEESKLEAERLSQTLHQVERQLRRREESLTAIINVIGTASYHPDIQVILKETLKHILEASERGGIWLLDDTSEMLAPATQSGLPQTLMRSWPRDEWEQDELLAPLMAGEIVYLDNPSAQRSEGLLGVLKAHGARVVVGTPLQIQKQTVGAMIIVADRQGHLQAHDAEQLTAVGQQLGQALERKKLHDDRRRLALKLNALRAERTERAQRQKDQLATLYQISQLLAQDMERAAKTVLKATIDALDASGGLILQRAPSQHRLIMTHQIGLSGDFVDNWGLRSITAKESPSLDWGHAPKKYAVLTANAEALPPLAADLLGPEQARGLVAIPLRWSRLDDEAMGLLMLTFPEPTPNQETSDETPFRFNLTEEQWRWLQLLTQMLTLSMSGKRAVP
jgi:GAF domain-containing protein